MDGVDLLMLNFNSLFRIFLVMPGLVLLLCASLLGCGSPYETTTEGWISESDLLEVEEGQFVVNLFRREYPSLRSGGVYFQPIPDYENHPDKDGKAPVAIRAWHTLPTSENEDYLEIYSVCTLTLRSGEILGKTGISHFEQGAFARVVEADDTE